MHWLTVFDLYATLVAHCAISSAVGCLPLPWESVGTAARRREPCGFRRRQKWAAGAHGSRAASAGARRDPCCFRGRRVHHLLSRPALGRGGCGWDPVPVSVRSGSRGPAWALVRQLAGPLSPSPSPLWASLVCATSSCLVMNRYGVPA